MNELPKMQLQCVSIRLRQRERSGQREAAVLPRELQQVLIEAERDEFLSESTVRIALLAGIMVGP